MSHDADLPLKGLFPTRHATITIPGTIVLCKQEIEKYNLLQLMHCRSQQYLNRGRKHKSSL